MSLKNLICSFVIAILVHGVSVGFAECTKDSDCNGDGVCADGKCTGSGSVKPVRTDKKRQAEPRSGKEQSKNKNFINSSNWHELPMRAPGNHISPIFSANSIEWSMPTRPSWTSSEIALNKALPENFSVEFEWKWTGGGTIEIFFPNSDEMTPDNWYPQKWYGVYISSEDLPNLHIYRRPSDDPEIGFMSPVIESSSDYKNSWVRVKVEKKGNEWCFYRNGTLIDKKTFGVLSRHEIGLIFAPSHGVNKGSDAKIVIKSVVIKKL